MWLEVHFDLSKETLNELFVAAVLLDEITQQELNRILIANSEYEIFYHSRVKARNFKEVLNITKEAKTFEIIFLFSRIFF